jgi:signal transduction histidine kinase
LKIKNGDMKFVDAFIPESYKSDNTTYSKARLLTLIGYIATFFSIITAAAYIFVGFYNGLFIVILPTISSFIYLSLIRFSGNLNLCANYLIISFLSLVTLFVVLSNGIYSPYIIWMVAVPVATYLLSGKKFGDVIFVVTISIIFVLAGLKYFDLEMPEMILGNWFSYFTLLSVVLFLFYIVFLVNWYLKIADQHQTELKDLNEKLKLSNVELERFAYIASHDMKTPIRNIISFLNLTERRAKSELSPELREYIDYASKSAKELNRLIEDILDYSRVTKTETHFKAIDLNQIMNQVSDSLTSQNAYQHVKVEFEQLPVFKAESSQMTQLFQNLIENGLKYNQSEFPKVKVKYQFENQKHFITVEDNGIGIEKDYFNTIFEMFKRLNNRDQYEGTGMGLAICKKIVERYNGNIWIESEPDSGSRFHISFPMN